MIKILEDDLLGGGATTPGQPPLQMEATPEPEAPKVEEQPKPEEEDKEPEEEKQYLGNSGDSEFFYLYIEHNDTDGKKDLQVIDASGKKLFSAVDNKLNVEDIKGFLIAVINNLEIANYSTDVITKYLVAETKPEIQKPQEKLELKDKDKKAETEVPGQEEPIKGMGEHTPESVVKLITKFGLNEKFNSLYSKFLKESKVLIRHIMGMQKAEELANSKKYKIKNPKIVLDDVNTGHYMLVSEFDQPLDIDKGAYSEGEPKEPSIIFDTKSWDSEDKNVITYYKEGKPVAKYVKAENKMYIDGQGVYTPGEEIKKEEPPVVEPAVKSEVEEAKVVGDLKSCPKCKEDFSKYNLEKKKIYCCPKCGYNLEKSLDKNESKIDTLLEKYNLNEEDQEHPLNKEIQKEGEDKEDVILPPDGEEPAKGPEGVVEPGVEDVPVGPEGAPGEPGLPPMQPNMQQPAESAEANYTSFTSREQAEAQIRMDYPEEPFTSTAITYADSLIHNPQVYGGLRNLKWEGVYTDSDTFLKQAKIVDEYREFSPKIAETLVNAVGVGENYKLARNGGPAVFFTVRDADKKIDLNTLRDLVKAKEVKLTKMDGEALILW